MKYNKVILIGLISSVLSYSMEQPLVPHTRVKIIKGSLYDADGTVDIVVVGSREQKRLNRSFKIVDKKGYEIDKVGAIKFMRPNLSSVNVIKREDDSNSVEETDHHPCGIIKHRDSNFYKKTMNSRVLVVVEPKLRNMWYGNQRENYRYSKNHDELEGEEAIEAAMLDLFICYQNVLKEGLKKLGDKKDKSIAIPTLSTSVVFPRKDAAFCAPITIIDFIKNNPGAYSCISLFVKKQFEYDQYRWFFAAHQLLVEDGSEEDSEMAKETSL
jgi:hypothetical protein